MKQDMKEEEDYDSDATVHLEDLDENPDRIARKRDKLEATRASVEQTYNHATNHKTDENTSPINSNDTRIDKQTLKKNKTASWVNSYCLVNLKPNEDTDDLNNDNQENNENVHTKMREELEIKRELKQERANYVVEQAIDDDVISISDDDCVIDESEHHRASEERVDKLNDAIFNQVDENKTNASIRVLKPSIINARRATVESFERNVTESRTPNLKSAANENEIKPRINVLKPSAINTRIATVTCAASNEAEFSYGIDNDITKTLGNEVLSTSASRTRKSIKRLSEIDNSPTDSKRVRDDTNNIPEKNPRSIVVKNAAEFRNRDTEHMISNSSEQDMTRQENKIINIREENKRTISTPLENHNVAIKTRKTKPNKTDYKLQSVETCVFHMPSIFKSSENVRKGVKSVVTKVNSSTVRAEHGFLCEEISVNSEATRARVEQMNIHAGNHETDENAAPINSNNTLIDGQTLENNKTVESRVNSYGLDKLTPEKDTEGRKNENQENNENVHTEMREELKIKRELLKRERDNFVTEQVIDDGVISISDDDCVIDEIEHQRASGERDEFNEVILTNASIRVLKPSIINARRATVESFETNVTESRTGSGIEIVAESNITGTKKACGSENTTIDNIENGLIKSTAVTLELERDRNNASNKKDERNNSEANDSDFFKILGSKVLSTNAHETKKAIKRFSKDDKSTTDSKRARNDTNNVLEVVPGSNVVTNTEEIDFTNTEHMILNSLEKDNETRQKNSDNADMLIIEQDNHKTSKEKNIKKENERDGMYDEGNQIDTNREIERVIKFQVGFCTLIKEHLKEKCLNYVLETEKQNALLRSANLLANEIENLKTLSNADFKFHCPLCASVTTYSANIYDNNSQNHEGRNKTCHFCCRFKLIYKSRIKAFLKIQSNNKDDTQTNQPHHNINIERAQENTQTVTTFCKNYNAEVNSVNHNENQTVEKPLSADTSLTDMPSTSKDSDDCSKSVVAKVISTNKRQNRGKPALNMPSTFKNDVDQNNAVSCIPAKDITSSTKAEDDLQSQDISVKHARKYRIEAKSDDNISSKSKNSDLQHSAKNMTIKANLSTTESRDGEKLCLRAVHKHLSNRISDINLPSKSKANDASSHSIANVTNKANLLTAKVGDQRPSEYDTSIGQRSLVQKSDLNMPSTSKGDDNPNHGVQSKVKRVVQTGNGENNRQGQEEIIKASDKKHILESSAANILSSFENTDFSDHRLKTCPTIVTTSTAAKFAIRETSKLNITSTSSVTDSASTKDNSTDADGNERKNGCIPIPSLKKHSLVLNMLSKSNNNDDDDLNRIDDFNAKTNVLAVRPSDILQSVEVSITSANKGPHEETDINMPSASIVNNDTDQTHRIVNVLLEPNTSITKAGSSEQNSYPHCERKPDDDESPTNRIRANDINERNKLNNKNTLSNRETEGSEETIATDSRLYIEKHASISNVYLVTENKSKKKQEAIDIISQPLSTRNKKQGNNNHISNVSKVTGESSKILQQAGIGSSNSGTNSSSNQTDNLHLSPPINSTNLKHTEKGHSKSKTNNGTHNENDTGNEKNEAASVAKASQKTKASEDNTNANRGKNGSGETQECGASDGEDSDDESEKTEDEDDVTDDVNEQSQVTEANLRVLNFLQELSTRIKTTMNTTENKQVESVKKPIITSGSTVKKKQNKKNLKSKVLYECKKCLCIFTYNSRYLDHMKNDHNVNDVKTPENCKIRLCPYCHLEVNHKSYNSHIKKKHPNKYFEKESTGKSYKVNNSTSNGEIEDKTSDSDKDVGQGHTEDYNDEGVSDGIEENGRDQANQLSRNKDGNMNELQKGKNYKQKISDTKNKSSGTGSDNNNTDSVEKDPRSAKSHKSEVHSVIETEHKRINLLNLKDGQKSRKESSDIEETCIDGIQQDGCNKNPTESNSTLNKDSNENNKQNEVFNDEKEKTRNYYYKCKLCDQICNSGYMSRKHRTTKHKDMKNKKMFDKILVTDALNRAHNFLDKQIESNDDEDKYVEQNISGDENSPESVLHDEDTSSAVEIASKKNDDKPNQENEHINCKNHNTNLIDEHNVDRESEIFKEISRIDAIDESSIDKNKNVADSDVKKNNTARKLMDLNRGFSRNEIKKGIVFDGSLGNETLRDDEKATENETASSFWCGSKSNKNKTNTDGDNDDSNNINCNVVNMKMTEIDYVFKCQDCDHLTKTYDNVIQHCQNHYTLNDFHANSLDRNYNKENHKLIKYSYKSLFKNWNKIFDGIPLYVAKEIKARSIYTTFCVKMSIIENGPWKYSLYQCGLCATCVPSQDIEFHCQHECLESISFECSSETCYISFTTNAARNDHENNHAAGFRLIAFNNTRDKEFNNTLFKVRETQQRESNDIEQQQSAATQQDVNTQQEEYADAQPELIDSPQEKDIIQLQEHIDNKPQETSKSNQENIETQQQYFESQQQHINPQRQNNINITQQADIYKCQCDLCFISSKNFKKHFIDCNFKTDLGVQCPKCAIQRLFEKDELEDHMALHHEKIKYEFKVYRVRLVLEENPSETRTK